jgi:hypothetical protein
MSDRAILKLKCECGADFEREDIPEDWKKIVHYKWKFMYCDACFKDKVEQAFKRMPEVLDALVNSKPQP